jgi:formylmethanofuran dehydrogenase subunit E
LSTGKATKATQGMSNLKIDRSVTSNRYKLAKSYGNSTSIQGNNVHIDKGKSVAYPIEEPVFSYKAILKKEPPKPKQENREDDTICERCSHILAKCFAKPKKKTMKGNRNQELVDLNQDLPYTLNRFNQDLALNMYSQKWLDRGQFLIKP